MVPKPSHFGHGTRWIDLIIAFLYNQYMKGKAYKYIGIPLLCIFCGLAGWQIRILYTNAQPSRLVEIRENSAEYHFINPLLLVDSPREAPEYSALKNQIEKYAADAKSKGSAESVSVYFRDLNSGRWIGADPDILYDPASTLKVAVMIGYLKAAEKDPLILEKRLDYVASVDPGQHYKPEHPLASGSYTVGDLIRSMIVDSDNTALHALYDNDRQDFVDVLKALQIHPPMNISSLDFMSPKAYSSLFRTLYSATYLSTQLSEQALKLLSITNFKQGIVAGAPTGTVIAHKFGENTSVMPDGTVEFHELHDCGIVYYPGHPYFLCVMTKGQDFTPLEKILSDISKIVYTKIDADNKK
jgi:beta-lactamase class A